MDTSQPIHDHVPRGYLSEKGKRRFTIIAGLLGAVFFFGQFIIPYVVLFALIPILGDFNADYSLDLEKAVYWKNKIWN